MECVTEAGDSLCRTLVDPSLDYELVSFFDSIDLVACSEQGVSHVEDGFQCKNARLPEVV